jgi:hypothetical protein
MKCLTLILVACATFGALLTPVQARTINWGNQALDPLFNSQGVSLDSTFGFEIGTFINGFVPTGSNVSDWSSNWIIFDRAFLNTDLLDTDEGPVPLNYFSSSATHQTNAQSSSMFTTTGATFPQNTQAYLWVYNSKTVSFSSEWALVADLIASGLESEGDAWRFPSPADDIGPPLTWSLSGAETALFGSVRNGVSRGDGSYTVAPTTFSLQTHQVPEPGGALLIASAGLLFLLRRTRFVGLAR